MYYQLALLLFFPILLTAQVELHISFAADLQLLPGGSVSNAFTPPSSSYNLSTIGGHLGLVAHVPWRKNATTGFRVGLYRGRVFNVDISTVIPTTTPNTLTIGRLQNFNFWQLGGQLEIISITEKGNNFLFAGGGLKYLSGGQIHYASNGNVSGDPNMRLQVVDTAPVRVQQFLQQFTPYLEFGFDYSTKREDRGFLSIQSSIGAVAGPLLEDSPAEKVWWLTISAGVKGRLF